ncbi:hypothetical protein NDU88_006984 [Pleurodeles waltl]|uniref:Uncharacterized protein n=1 Tax=Pleurodeles waltl TaxID=8319 RepID=A0AAV7TZZ5_PLEWA|nr:hypothetical protein NDU88_006984 [Pleurodeles waltl]
MVVRRVIKCGACWASIVSSTSIASRLPIEAAMDERVAEALRLLRCGGGRSTRKAETQVRGSGRGRWVFGVRATLGRSVCVPSQPADLVARSRTMRVSRQVGEGWHSLGGRLAGLPCPIGAGEVGGDDAEKEGPTYIHTYRVIKTYNEV